MTILIQVDKNDTPIGLIEKQDAHVKGVLHRAFSIFVFRKQGSSYELLLQQRASSKYHSGGLWTNTCCSHAEPGISLEETAQKRLKEEMGFTCPLQYVDSFYYKAVFENGMIEHEIDHVFVSIHDPKTIHVDPSEADSWEWVAVNTIQKRLKANEASFTAWFPQAFEIAILGLHT